MMIAIINGVVVNESERFEGYVLIQGRRIKALGRGECPREVLSVAQKVVDAAGCYVIAGVIDDQVHFREPGMTAKADIATESRAALAGGVTSYMEMPNTSPATITIERLEQKFARAAEVSAVNYSFYLGATNNNLDQIEKIDPTRVCGVKVFMGSSTGDMLVDEQQMLANIFKYSPTLVATHCEQEEIVRANLERAKAQFGMGVTIDMHPVIRSAEACYICSSRAVELATKYNTRLHVLHLSTAKELTLFEDKPLLDKRITNEVCVHHLWFTDQDYARKGNFIKWNPAIKSASDREALRRGVLGDLVDVVATDHAPHTMQEKLQPYLQAPSGGPLVQFSLVAMLEMFDVETVVRKMCHNPATLYGVVERGFLREGYMADVVVVERDSPWTLAREQVISKCGWSPLEGESFSHRVKYTFVNGSLAYDNGAVDMDFRGDRLEFKSR